MEPIGQTLKEARERRGISLDEVQGALHIRGPQLEAMEAEEFDKLPAPAYARAFIRQYARYLGLDPEPLVQDYNTRFGNEPPSINVGWTAAPTTERRWGAGSSIAVGAVMAAALLLGGVYAVHLFLAGKADARRALVPRPAAEAPAPSTRPATPAVPARSPASLPELPGAAPSAGAQAVKPGTAPAPMVPPRVAAPAAPGTTSGAGVATPAPAGASPAGPPAVTATPAPRAPVVAPPAPGPTAVKPLPAPGSGLPARVPQPGAQGTAGGAKPQAAPGSHLAPGGGAPTAQGASASAAAVGGVETVLRASERCWVRVLADGKMLFEGSLRPGDRRSWRAAGAIDMTLGNAGGVRLSVNGEDLGRAGRPGQVLRRVFRPDATRVAGAAAPDM